MTVCAPLALWAVGSDASNNIEIDSKNDNQRDDVSEVSGKERADNNANHYNGDIDHNSTLVHIHDNNCNNSSDIPVSETEFVPIDEEENRNRSFRPHPVKEYWVLRRTKSPELCAQPSAGNLPLSCNSVTIGSLEVESLDGESALGGEKLNNVHSVIDDQGQGVPSPGIARQRGGQGDDDVSPEATTQMVSSEQVLSQELLFLAEPVKCYFCELGGARLSRTNQAECFHLELERTGKLGKGNPSEEEIKNLASYLGIDTCIARKVLEHLGVGFQTQDTSNKLSFVRRICWDNMNSLEDLCNSFELVWVGVNTSQEFYDILQEHHQPPVLQP